VCALRGPALLWLVELTTFTYSELTMLASRTADLRSTTRAREIVEAARRILESDGGSALTMRRLAADLGMKAPSLYKHFPDKESLELELVVLGFEETTAAFEAALASRPRSQIAALGVAYRDYARAHPHIYRLMTDRPLPRERLPVGLEYRATAPLTQAMGSVAGARAAWALAHGLVMLEINGRFPADADVDAAWDVGVTALESVKRT
jgi:AcrR family transcriptional regulator